MLRKQQNNFYALFLVILPLVRKLLVLYAGIKFQRGECNGSIQSTGIAKDEALSFSSSHYGRERLDHPLAFPFFRL